MQKGTYQSFNLKRLFIHVTVYGNVGKRKSRDVNILCTLVHPNVLLNEVQTLCCRNKTGLHEAIVCVNAVFAPSALGQYCLLKQ